MSNDDMNGGMVKPDAQWPRQVGAMATGQTLIPPALLLLAVPCILMQ